MVLQWGVTNRYAIASSRTFWLKVLGKKFVIVQCCHSMSCE